MKLPLIVLGCLVGLGVVGYLVTKIQISYYSKSATGAVPQKILTTAALSVTAIKWGLIAWAGIGLVHLLAYFMES